MQTKSVINSTEARDSFLGNECLFVDKGRFSIKCIYLEEEGCELFLTQTYYPHCLFKIIETNSKNDFHEKYEGLSNKKYAFSKLGCFDFIIVFMGIIESSETSQIIKEGWDYHIRKSGDDAVKWWFKKQNKVRKKLVEKQEFSHLGHLMRQEFGNDILVKDSESPDFIVITPKESAIGVEMTECTPYPHKREDADFEYKVIRKFRDNEYLLSITKDNKLSIIFYPMPSFYRGRADIDECCAEIEIFVRLWHEGNIDRIKFLTHIQRIVVFEIPASASNAIDFDHSARRDAVRAIDLLESIQKKEIKLPKFKLKDNAWLCIYLPNEENLHPYDIIYDDDCTEEEFNKKLEASNFKRIYMSSFGAKDIKQLKPIL